MQKQFRLTMILVVILLLLIGSFYMVRHINNTESKKQEEDSVKDAIHLYSVSQGDITEFSYTVSGDTLKLVRKGDDWTLEQDASVPVKKDVVSMMLMDFENLTADRKITGSDAKGKDFGFEDPSNVITITTAEGTKTFTFGMENEITREYYLIVDQDVDNIYVMNTSIPTTCSKSIEELTTTEDTAATEMDTNN